MSSDLTSAASSSSNSAQDTKLSAAHASLFEAGKCIAPSSFTSLDVRRQVMSDNFVDTSLGNANEFTMECQKLATEAAWGTIWTRPGLSLRDRSLTTISMLAAMGKSNELQGHVIGGLRNGLTKSEIQEALLQAMVYAGMPTGLEAFRAADAAIKRFDEQDLGQASPQRS
ncbi:hypothetical protein OIV83_005387 [Microbotryomycetes sp. JL201]|nr:hypothetical protein OIV83_005387 [Microbotryomycetes sp. JL201]